MLWPSDDLYIMEIGFSRSYIWSENPVNYELN